MPGRFAEPSDPAVREDHDLPPKSYADAIVSDEPAGIDEDLIKETPPRQGSNDFGAPPRPLGEVLDEDQELHQPATPTQIPGQSYAEVAAAPASPSSFHHRRSSELSDVDSSPDGHRHSPLRRMRQRIPSHTLNGGNRREVSDSMTSSFVSDHMESSMTTNGDMVFEEVNGKHGEALVTAVPKTDYDQKTPKDKTDQEKEQSQTRDELVSGQQAGHGWQQSAIHWAPLNVPLQRRLQTLMVLLHTLSIALFVSLFFFLCSIPLLWPLIVPYLIYLLFSTAATNGSLRHRSPFLRSLPIWSLFAGYFPARLHRSAPLPATRKYIFGYHPHGIISHGAFAAFATEALGFSSLFPGITNTLLTIESNFRIPLYRDWALRLGLASVSRASCEAILTRGGPNNQGMGRAITIVVGGAAESLDARPGAMKLILRRRKGFVKLAVRTGADLVPVLAFGENELYEQVDGNSHPWVHAAQMRFKKLLGFTVPLFHARGVFNYDVGLLPYRRPVNIVVGRPVQVVRQREPDPAYVDALHEQYVEELMGIWQAWRERFAPGTGELEIVE